MSRSDARSRRLRHRRSRTVPASITAVLLVAIGVLAAIAAISRLVTNVWATQVTGAAGAVAGQTWNSAWVITAGVVAAVLGLVLLIAGLAPGGFTSATLQTSVTTSSVDETDYVISNRAIAHLAAAAADDVDGVDNVSASASGRRVDLRVTTTSEQADQIRERVRTAVTDILTSAGVSPAPRVGATVRTKEI